MPLPECGIELVDGVGCSLFVSCGSGRGCGGGLIVLEPLVQVTVLNTSLAQETGKLERGFVVCCVCGGRV